MEKKIDLKAGNKVLCTKDVYMIETGAEAYTKGRVYSCEYNDCITDNGGDKHHLWVKDDDDEECPSMYFVNIDKVNHPPHYTWLKEKCGIEVIDITRHLDFCTGSAVKYLLRAGYKSEEGYSDKAKTIEDLKKAIWYIEDKIKQVEDEVN